MRGIFFGDIYSEEKYNAGTNYVNITPPAVKVNYVDITGGNSSIDLTEAVGGIVFEDGTMELKFSLRNYEKKEQMKNDLHGKRMNITLEKDAGFYYDGRIKCISDEWIKGIYELSFSVRLTPYKYEKHETLHHDRVDGISKYIYLPNLRMPVMPQIAVEGNIVLTYEGLKFALNSGIYVIAELTLQEGLNKIKLSGTGGITFRYRRGQLI